MIINYLDYLITINIILIILIPLIILISKLFRQQLHEFVEPDRKVKFCLVARIFIV